LNEATTLSVPTEKKIPFPERGIIKPLSVSFLPLKLQPIFNARKKLKWSYLLLDQSRFGMLPKKGTEALSFHVVTSIDFVCRTRVVLIYLFIILAASCALDNCMEKQIVYK